MLILDHAVRCTLRRTALMWIVTLLAIALPATVQGQVTGFVTAAVGGVSVDAKGALRIVDLAREGYFDRIRLEAIPGAMNHDAEFRKVSLAALEAALKECLDSGKPIPDAMQTLAGLQGIRYMLLYPEQHDIVLVGPAGPWKVDKRGNVVGVANGRPVLLLDDLVTALRALGGRVRMLMTCSIDPTQEGIQRVRSLRKHKESDPDPAEAAAAFEQALGPQKITVTGVPDTSHFAQVMVAADYRMKRISMSQEPAPIDGLPGFMDLVQTPRGGNMLPRWWLEPSFEPLVRDEQGLSWELRGVSVKTMTETDYFDANGIQHPTGKADAISQRWANMMTDRYEELARVDSAFGQLRSCMDLAVVAALMVKENLAEKAVANSRS